MSLIWSDTNEEGGTFLFQFFNFGNINSIHHVVEAHCAAADSVICCGSISDLEKVESLENS